MGIGPLMEGRDVVLAAETGSGKTYAYLLPIMTHILNEKRQLQTSTPPQDNTPLYDELEESELGPNRCGQSENADTSSYMS